MEIKKVARTSFSENSRPRRDNAWLLSRLNELWSKFFADVSQENPVMIRFGRYSKYRLGSIKQNPYTRRSLITITAMFKDEKIPVEVIDHTIAHELVHYTHGFSSSRKQLHRYPHAGGVVKREMADRQLANLHEAYRKWVRLYRQQLSQRR